MRKVEPIERNTHKIVDISFVFRLSVPNKFQLLQLYVVGFFCLNVLRIFGCRTPECTALRSPVDADYAQSHNGRGAAHHIHGDENVTEELSENPLTADQVRDTDEGHHGQSHRQVSHGQRHDQVVGRLTELLDKAHRDDHEQVPADGGQREHGEDAADQDLLRPAVAEDLLAAARPVWLHELMLAGGGRRRRRRRCSLRGALRDHQQPWPERLRDHHVGGPTGVFSSTDSVLYHERRPHVTTGEAPVTRAHSNHSAAFGSFLSMDTETRPVVTYARTGVSLLVRGMSNPLSTAQHGFSYADILHERLNSCVWARTHHPVLRPSLFPSNP